MSQLLFRCCWEQWFYHDRPQGRECLGILFEVHVGLRRHSEVQLATSVPVSVSELVHACRSVNYGECTEQVESPSWTLQLLNVLTAKTSLALIRARALFLVHVCTPPSHLGLAPLTSSTRILQSRYLQGSVAFTLLLILHLVLLARSVNIIIVQHSTRLAFFIRSSCSDKGLFSAPSSL